MITLGLDPSLTGFGWSVHNSSVYGPGRVVAKGVFETLSSRVFVWRYMFLREAVRALLARYPDVEAIGVESPPFGEQFSEGLYGLFLYVNEAVFTARKDVVFFDPQTVKRLAKGDPSIRKGSMDKGDMIDAAKVDTGVKSWNHNEADAYIIARSAARFWEFVKGALQHDELTPSEADAFDREETPTRGPRAGRTFRHGLLHKENERYFRFSLLGPQETMINLEES